MPKGSLPASVRRRRGLESKIGFTCACIVPLVIGMLVISFLTLRELRTLIHHFYY